MKTHFKRLLSLALAVVMVFGILPMNALPAQAVDTLTVSAYPAKVAVGQESQIFIKGENNVSITEGFTATSSNDAIAKVEGTKLVGVHSGTATITVTDGTGATGSFEVEVTTVSKYVISSHSFNIGIDKEGNDGVVDHFGGTWITPEDNNGDVLEPTFTPNNFTRDANKYIPFVVTGSYRQTYSGTYLGVSIPLNNALWYSNRPGAENWQRIMPMYNASAYAANKKYFETYDYLNLNKTAPWQWVAEKSSTGTYDIQTGTTWIDKDYAQITRGQATFGYDYRWEYITLKLDVPASGNYKIEVDTGKTAGINEVFYMAPTSVEFNGAQTPSNPFFGTDTYKLFNIDLGAGNTTGSTERYLEKGEYHFVVHCCGDTTVATSKSTVGYISSITLTMEEWTDPALNVEDSGMLVGTNKTLEVSNSSTLGETVDFTDVEYTVSGDEGVLELQEKGDGTATVVAKKAGTATVTATVTYNGETVTDTVTFNVKAQLDYLVTLGAFNVGDGENFIPVGNSSTAGVYKHASAGNLLYMAQATKFPNPTYQNPTKTAPWTWFTQGNVSNNALYLASSNAYIEYPAFSEGKEPYFVVKLFVSDPGNYTVDINAYYKRTHNQHYYLIPGSVVDAASTRNEAFWFNDDYKLGELDAAKATTATFTSYEKDNNSNGVALSENTYYFVTKYDNDGTNTGTSGTIAQFKSITLTPEVFEAAEVSAPATNTVGVGMSSSIKVTQTGSLGTVKTLNATYASSDNKVLYVTSEDGVAKVTPVGKGNAKVTVTYTDVFGIEHNEEISYEVIDAEAVTYDFRTRAFNIGNPTADGMVFFNSAEVKDEQGAYKAGYEWVTTPNDWTDTSATKFIPFYATLANGSQTDLDGNTATTDSTNVWYRRQTSQWFLYPQKSGMHKYIKNTYEYQNPNNTAPWQYVTSANNDGNGVYFCQDVSWFYFASIKDKEGDKLPYIIFKVVVPAAGTYNLSMVSGTSTSRRMFADTHIYMAPADGDAVWANIATEDNKVASFKRDKYSYTSDTNFTLDKAGEYYLMYQFDDSLGADITDTTTSAYFRTITLTPVVEDLAGFKVAQQASLGENIKLNLTVPPSGSKVAGYKVFFDDEQLTSFALEAGSSQDLSLALAANQMSKKIIFQGVDDQGNDFGEPKVITLGEYLKDIIDGKVTATEEEIKMAKHTYNYCAKAQILANKDLDALEGYSVDVTIEDPEEFTGNLYTGETAGIAPYSMSMLLENTVTLRLYFTLTEGELADYTFTYNGQTLTPAVRAKDGKVYVDITGINPQAYDVGRSVTVTKAGEGDLVVTYSPLIYIQRTFRNPNTSVALKDLVKAMYGYHLAAVECTTN